MVALVMAIVPERSFVAQTQGDDNRLRECNYVYHEKVVPSECVFQGIMPFMDRRYPYHKGVVTYL